MLITPNMRLTLPKNTDKITKIEGTYGQDWADILNRAFVLVDAHDHSEYDGVQISSDNVKITSDFDINNYGTENLKYVSFLFNENVIETNLSLYTKDNVDLYVKDGNGNEIQITQSGSVNTDPIKGFLGSFVASGASAVYTNNDQKYTFYNNNSIGLGNCTARNYLASNFIVSTISCDSALFGNIKNNGLQQADLTKIYAYDATGVLHLDSTKYSSKKDPSTYVFIDQSSTTAVNTYFKDSASDFFDTPFNYKNFPILESCDYCTNYSLNNAPFKNRIKVLTGPVPDDYQMNVVYKGYFVSFSLVCKSTSIANAIITTTLNDPTSLIGQYYCNLSVDQSLNANVHVSMRDVNEYISTSYDHYFIMYLEPIV